jgi:putative FmdB family regulatory protein
VPVYEYACTECGERLEVHQSFSDDALTVCPACDGRLRKVLSAVGVVFKGSGFYRTDSRASATADGGSKEGSNTKTTGEPATSTTSSSEGGSSTSSGAGSSDSSSSGSRSGDSGSSGSSSSGSSSGGSSGAKAAS